MIRYIYRFDWLYIKTHTCRDQTSNYDYQTMSHSKLKIHLTSIKCCYLSTPNQILLNTQYMTFMKLKQPGHLDVKPVSTTGPHRSHHHISIENRHMKPLLFLPFPLPKRGTGSNTRGIYILLALLYLKLFAQLHIPGPQ